MSCCGCILYNNDSYLLVQEPSKGYRWGFPKGKMEQNESAIQCATRELYEETGIKIDVKDIDINNKIEFNFHSIKYVYFLYEYNGKLPPYISNNEIIDIRWFKKKDIIKDITIGTTYKVIDRLR